MCFVDVFLIINNNTSHCLKEKINSTEINTIKTFYRMIA